MLHQSYSQVTVWEYLSYHCRVTKFKPLDSLSDFTSLFFLAFLPHLSQVTQYSENNIDLEFRDFESQMCCLLVYNLKNYLALLKAFIFAF